VDLLARVRIDEPKRVVDLGCGPGNSTEMPAAAVNAGQDLIGAHLVNIGSGWYVQGVMGIDAVALIHCTKPKLLKKLASSPLGEDYAEQLKRVTEAVQKGEDVPLAVSLSVLGVGSDFAKISTGVRFRELEADPLFAQMLAHRVLEVLPPGAHDDERGILFYPDVAEPFSETYPEVVAELEEGSVWASTVAVDPETRQAWLHAKMNEMEEALADPQAMLANAAANPQQFFADRMKAASDAWHAHLDKLGVFSPKEGDHVLSGIEVTHFDGTKTALPPISLENAAKLLHPELRPKSFSPEDLADSNRKFLDRIRKVGTPEQVKQWEQAFGQQAKQPDQGAKVSKRTSKKPKR
jgi:hypothetical protein